MLAAKEEGSFQLALSKMVEIEKPIRNSLLVALNVEPTLTFFLCFGRPSGDAGNASDANDATYANEANDADDANDAW